MNILQAIEDPKLFAPWFRDKATWAAWRAFLATLFGLPLAPDQWELHAQCTGRQMPPPPGQAINEAWVICGRRAGKSFVLALIAVYLACFRDYRDYLQPGERGTVIVIAADKKQARTIMRYIRAMLLRIPMLKKRIERETSELFELTKSVRSKLVQPHSGPPAVKR